MIDALSLDWRGLLGYAFPPFPILAKVIRKARLESASLILIAPRWPAQPWYPDLLNLVHVPPVPLLLGRKGLLQPRSGIPLPPSATQRHTSSESGGASSSRLAGMRQAMLALGASTDTVGLVDSSHRGSTHTVYGHYWQRWLRWADSHFVDPFHPSNVQLATFLSFFWFMRS